MSHCQQPRCFTVPDMAEKGDWPGVRSRLILRGHESAIGAAAWSPDGTELATVSDSSGLIVFDATTGEQRATQPGWGFGTVSWHPQLDLIAGITGEDSPRIQITTGRTLATTVLHDIPRGTPVDQLVWANHGRQLVAISDRTTALHVFTEDLTLDHSVALPAFGVSSRAAWTPSNDYIVMASYAAVYLIAQAGAMVESEFSGGAPFAISPTSDRIAIAHDSSSLHIVDLATGSLLVEVPLDGALDQLSWSPCGRFVIGAGSLRPPRSTETTQYVVILRTDTWDVAMQTTRTHLSSGSRSAFGFSPSSDQLRVALPVRNRQDVEIVTLEPAALLREDTVTAQRYTTAKIVLVGDSGVGKTGLGYRIANGEFKDHPSTHGQHFWLVDELGHTRTDGTECEAVIWDLAGQPDYRLTHVLFLDDVDAAAIVFDATRGPSALDGVQFWIDALRAEGSNGKPKCPIILVGARLDRGGAALSPEELNAFTERYGLLGGYVATSAMTGEGTEALIARLRDVIGWDAMSATIATETFRVIKDRILALKQASGEGGASKIVSIAELEEQALAGLPADSVRPAETDLWNAVQNLSNHGYVRMLRDATGARVILLQPELLQNLAASIVLAARRNLHGLGAINEGEALDGAYAFPELEQLGPEHGEVLLDAAIVLLLEHHVCFRERLGEQTLLIFPELINEKPQTLATSPAEDRDLTYIIEGNIQNVYASLVVLLGYTNILTRVDQWQDRAEYELEGQRVGFEQRRAQPSRLELTLLYEPRADEGLRRLFQGLVEQFLRRRGISVRRYPAVRCPECQTVLQANQVIRVIDKGSGKTFCPDDGHQIPVPTEAAPVTMTDEQELVVTRESRSAKRRTALAVALTQLQRYREEHFADRPTPSCFVSYAWGVPEDERWVRRRLVPDLRAAGVNVILDVEAATFGDDLARFVERLDGADFALVVGTPEYLTKHDNLDPDHGAVVAAEADLLKQRMLGTEARKRSVIPLILSGTRETSLPPLLRGQLNAEFKIESFYFGTLFKLVLKLWDIPQSDPAVAELIRDLGGGEAEL